MLTAPVNKDQDCTKVFTRTFDETSKDLAVTEFNVKIHFLFSLKVQKLSKINMSRVGINWFLLKPDLLLLSFDLIPKPLLLKEKGLKYVALVIPKKKLN